jgi:hypothetical protein
MAASITLYGKTGGAAVKTGTAGCDLYHSLNSTNRQASG